jgi:hypothetical protein
MDEDGISFRIEKTKAEIFKAAKRTVETKGRLGSFFCG